MTDPEVLDVAIIGSGFAGIAMAWHLERAGIRSFALFEKARDLGGVWRENTYPGAACDVASHSYCFSFEQDYPWNHRFSQQSDILEYLHHCARKFGIDRHIRFGKEVCEATFDEGHGRWKLVFADGSTALATSVVSAVGQLHRPSIPAIPGIDDFRGAMFHSARWDHHYDFRGKTVAVIGTGASAIQFVPEIAKETAQLYVFQRSPGWVIPRFQWAYTSTERWLMRTFPGLRSLDRRRVNWFLEWVGGGFRGTRWIERMVDWTVRGTLWLQVRDPELRRKLTPDYPVGCKRMLVTSSWLPTLCRPDVEVVTDAIREIAADSVVTADGQRRRADAIVFGTGFAATEFLAPMRVVGVGGKALHDTWRDGASAYLGMTVAGFPNFFVMYGPNTNLGAGSVLFMLECQARYIARLLQLRAEQGWSHADVLQARQDEFAAEIRARSATTAFESTCNGWHKNAQGLNTNNWIGAMKEYETRTAEPNLADFCLTTVHAEQAATQAATV